jgi:hypothetical protein
MFQEIFLKEVLPVVSTVAVGILVWALKAAGGYLKAKTKSEVLQKAVDFGEKIAEIAVVGAAQAYVSTAKDRGQWGDNEKKEALRRAVEAYKKLWTENFGSLTESDASIEHRLEAKLGQLKAEGALPS